MKFFPFTTVQQMVGLVVPEGGNPPLTTSTAQTESSNIQAQFAAQVAACVGEKGNQGNEKKSETETKTRQRQTSS